jgi:hypothetical protein
VPIKFDVDFSTDVVLPKHLGRLQLGGYVCRLYFDLDGLLKLHVPQEAIGRGITVEPERSEEELYMLGPPLPEGTTVCLGCRFTPDRCTCQSPAPKGNAGG